MRAREEDWTHIYCFQSSEKAGGKKGEIRGKDLRWDWYCMKICVPRVSLGC